MLIIRYTLEIYYFISFGHMVYATQSVSSSDFDCLFQMMHDAKSQMTFVIGTSISNLIISMGIFLCDAFVSQENIP